MLAAPLDFSALVVGFQVRDGDVLVLGGVCDHRPKPGIALRRAAALLGTDAPKY